jgi:hypothetical protein
VDSPGFLCTSWQQDVSLPFGFVEGVGAGATTRPPSSQIQNVVENTCNPHPASEGSLEKVTAQHNVREQRTSLHTPIVEREELALHIRSGIARTIERVPDLTAIAVPWGSGEDVAPGSWEILLSELESAAQEHSVEIYLVKWGSGKGPGEGIACLAEDRVTRVQFSANVDTKQFNAGIFYHINYDAEGRATVEETIKRQFKSLPRANVGRGGKRSIQEEGGIQTQLKSNDTREDVAYHICGQAAAIRAALNLHQVLVKGAANNSGIQR